MGEVIKELLPSGQFADISTLSCSNSIVAQRDMFMRMSIILSQAHFATYVLTSKMHPLMGVKRLRRLMMIYAPVSYKFLTPTAWHFSEKYR